MPAEHHRHIVRLRLLPRLAGVSCAVMLIATVIGFSSDPAPVGATEPGPEPVVWEPCVGDENLPAEVTNEDLRCGSLMVPLDHADPGGPMIRLALVKAPARDPAARVGSLVVNPGGPGGPGLEYAANLSTSLQGPAAERFDLVGFDPRGVGLSEPAPRCETGAAGLSLTETDPVTYFEAANAAEAPANTACAVSLARYGQYLGTKQVARDLEWIRQAIGDEPLNYWGGSYGTRIGMVYAQLYPDRYRTILADGSVDPHGTYTTMQTDRGGSYDDAFGLFSETFGDSRGQFDELHEVLAQGPVEILQDGEHMELTLDELSETVLTSLRREEEWPDIAERIDKYHRAVFGNEEIAEPNIDGDSPTPLQGTADNMMTMNSVVNCVDLDGKPAPEQMPALAEQMMADGPLFGSYMAMALTACQGLEIPSDPLSREPPAGTSPILVLGSRYDPATPYVWSERMAEFLDGSELLTYDGAKHIVRILNLECIVDHTDSYLVNLTMPPPGTSCAFVPPTDPDEIL